MKTSIRIHQNAFKSTRVNFTENEQKALDSYSVKTATLAAVQAWKSVKKDTLAFANRLKRVHALMTKGGNNPKSLFSKWLKSVGIPRATAYWTLKRHGVSSLKQPSVKQLIQKREKLQIDLAKAKRDDKSGIQSKLDSVKTQLSRRREVLENRLKSISAELKEVMTAVSAFSGTPEAKGFDADIAKWLASNDRMLSKMTTSQQQEYLRVFTNAIADEAGLPALKKPVGSVRLTDHRQIATA